MKTLGRRIVVSFGKHTIALEKLVRQKPEDVGLTSEPIPYGKPLEGAPVINVYEISDLDGERVERLLGPAVGQAFGLDVNTYFTDPCFWTTKEDG